jgi:heme-degrading monooxygenase HmoA
VLLERAEISVTEGSESEFATALSERGVPLLTSVPGVKSVSFGRGIEHPGKFMLLVEWESMEAHAAFNKTPACTRLRELIRPYSKGGSMEHFQMR